ncbi:MAG: hypothetical protein IJY04_00825 [Clostridia bacterium]|nr:hypothetical protein [Clostridia bacterium]
MIKKLLSILLAAITLFSATATFTACSDKELAAFEGELYCEILPIKDGAKGIITIVHDDGDYSTVSYMNTQFKSMGLTASVAMVANKVVDENGKETKDAEKWKNLIKESGFDIVCHSQNHSFYGLTDEAHSGTYEHRDNGTVEYDFPAGNITNMTAGAAERLRKVFKSSNQKVCTYAIPGLPVLDSAYNGLNEEASQILADNFIACRYSGGSATYGDVTIPCMNDLSAIDYQRLHSLSTITSGTSEEWIKYVDDAIQYGGWGIFLMHQIINQETDYIYNVSKEKAVLLFRHIGKKVKAGELWCASLTEAVLYNKELETASAFVETSGKGIAVSVYDDLDDNATFDQPLTIKVQVLDSWGDTAKVKYDGEKFEVPVYKADDGTKYVMVNVAPDKGVALINKG